MSLICLNKCLTLVSANREIVFFDSSNNFLSKLTLEPIAKKQPASLEEPDDVDVSDEPMSSQVQDMCLSPNGKLLAITTTGDKLLYLYELLANNNVQLLSKRDLSRTSSTVKFSPDSLSLLIGDKTGDCFLFDCAEPCKPAKWLLGHLSMILDVLFTNDKKFIITCDRDEKIRLTNYPDTHIIESYCLGHTEYVGAIEFLPAEPNDVLVSISGDKHLKLWQLPDGKELFDYELPQPALKLAVKIHQNNSCSLIGVTFADTFNLIVYKISRQDGVFCCEPVTEHRMNNSKYISNIQFDSNGSLLFASVDTNNSISMFKLKFDDQCQMETLNGCNEILAQHFGVITIDSENYSILFKKKYDNVLDYQERKKRRIEEKNKCR